MSAPTGEMSALRAARMVLSEAGEPLHAKDITKRILDTGLWKTSSKTPVSSVAARIAEDITSKGQASPFRRVGPGVFALADQAETKP